jgi:hypothetical protein
LTRVRRTDENRAMTISGTTASMCPSCGTPAPDGARFCAACGSALTVASTPPFGSGAWGFPAAHQVKPVTPLFLRVAAVDALVVAGLLIVDLVLPWQRLCVAQAGCLERSGLHGTPSVLLLLAVIPLVVLEVMALFELPGALGVRLAAAGTAVLVAGLTVVHVEQISVYRFWPVQGAALLLAAMLVLAGLGQAIAALLTIRRPPPR